MAWKDLVSEVLCVHKVAWSLGAPCRGRRAGSHHDARQQSRPPPPQLPAHSPSQAKECQGYRKATHPQILHLLTGA